MEVKSYTFQSPYPSQVQVGQADKTSQQSDKSQEESAVQVQENIEALNGVTQNNQSQPDAPERLLDVYA
ncbi:MAG: hypothetical protein U9R50_08955 [Campylobacterota bacterium]|nr:hypothetical protein [Campylobacterota bacterium]